MTNLTQWKEEARAEFYDKGPALETEKEADYMDSFLDTLIDRIHAHTLEEVRGKVEVMKNNPIVADMETAEVAHAYNQALSDILVELELLEHPTD